MIIFTVIHWWLIYIDGGELWVCLKPPNIWYRPCLFLWSRSNKPQVVSTCFSFSLWLLLTVQWPNKGNQICFYLDVSQCSLQFRIHLRGSLFQEAQFQYHKASVCLSMSTSTTPTGIMTWVKAQVERRFHQLYLTTKPGSVPRPRPENKEHEKMSAATIVRNNQCLQGSSVRRCDVSEHWPECNETFADWCFLPLYLCVESLNRKIWQFHQLLQIWKRN